MFRSQVYHKKSAGVPSLAVIGMALLMLCSGCSPVRYSSHTDNYLKAKDLFQRGRYQDAAKYYQIYLEEYPDSRLQETILFRLGQCYRYMNNFAEARASFQALVERYQSGFWVDRAQRELSELP